MLLTMFWKWEKYYTYFTCSVMGRLISESRLLVTQSSTHLVLELATFPSSILTYQIWSCGDV